MNQEAVALYDIKMFYDLNSDLEQKKVSYSYSMNSVKKTLCVIAKLIVKNEKKNLRDKDTNQNDEMKKSENDKKDIINRKKKDRV